MYIPLSIGTHTFTAFLVCPFQSDRISVYTSSPDVTQCFQKTVLCWLPTLYLLVASCVYVPMLVRTRTVNRFRHTSKFNSAKLVSTTHVFVSTKST